MAKGTVGPDGLPIDRHHPGRLNGKTGLSWKTVKVMGSMALILTLIIGCVTPPPKTPAATANVLKLERITHNPIPEFWPKLSPDGSKLLFHVRDDNKEGRARWSIVMVELGKAGRKLVAGPYALVPDWFPDNTHFVFSYAKGESKLVKSSLKGPGITFITPSPMGSWDNQPAVSPDGNTIAFHTGISKEKFICTVNSDGSEFTVYVKGTFLSGIRMGKFYVLIER